MSLVRKNALREILNNGVDKKKRKDTMTGIRYTETMLTAIQLHVLSL